MEKLMSLMIGLEEAATEAVQTTDQFAMFDNLFSFIMIAAGVFAIYSAVTGTGPAYKNDFPKSMQKEANKLLQKFLWIIGPLATITGILDLVYPDASWPYLVSLGTVLPTIIVYIVMFRRKFKDDLKRMR